MAHRLNESSVRMDDAEDPNSSRHLVVGTEGPGLAGSKAWLAGTGGGADTSPHRPLCRPRICAYAVFAALFVLLLGLGVLSYVGGPRLVVHLAVRKLGHMADPTSVQYPSFINPYKDGVRVHVSYYIFNITNSDNVTKGEKPILKRLGPFVYENYQVKVLDESGWRVNGTFRYKYHSYYVFRPEFSAYPTDEVPVMAINLGIAGLLSQLQTMTDLNPDIGPILNLVKDLANTMTMEAGTKMFRIVPARVALWGYEDQLLKKLGLNPFVRTADNDTALYYEQPSEVISGVTGVRPGPEDYMRITMWAGHRGSLPESWWKTKYANMINGTDCTNFPPQQINVGTTVHCFVDSLLRGVEMEAKNRVMLDGVSLHRLELTERNDAGPEENPNNAAFYMPQRGFMPFPPAVNRPVVITKPFFYQCGKEWTNVTFLDYDEADTHYNYEHYETMLDIEPLTGDLFEAHKRMQLTLNISEHYFQNPLTQQTEVFEMTRGLKRTWLPLIYLDQHFMAPRKVITSFKQDFLRPINIFKGVGIALLCMGGIGFALLAVAMVAERR